MITWILDKLSKIPHGAAILKENDELKERNAELEVENKQLHQKVVELDEQLTSADYARVMPEGAAPLDEETTRILVYLFEHTPNGAAASLLAQRLNLKQSVVEYHLDTLEHLGLLREGGGDYVEGQVWWVLRSEGRKYVMDNGLSE